MSEVNGAPRMLPAEEFPWLKKKKGVEKRLKFSVQQQLLTAGQAGPVAEGVFHGHDRLPQLLQKWN